MSGVTRTALQPVARGADEQGMAFEVLALALLAGGRYVPRWGTGPLLPAQDRPPVGLTPMPRHVRLQGYVADGIADLDEYLAGWDADPDADWDDAPDGDWDADPDTSTG